MIIDLIRFFIYLFFTITAGSAVLGLFPLKKLKPPFYIKLSWAYLLGVGGITWWMFVLSNFTSFSIFKIIAPWLLIFGYKFHKNYNDHRKNHHPWLRKPMMIRLTKQDIFFIFLIFIQLVFVTYQALSRESLAFDALNNWIFKAKIFYMERDLKPDFFNNEIHLSNATLLLGEKRLHYLPDYPLLVPLNVTFFFMVFGRVDLITLKLIWIIFFLILLINFNFFISLFNHKFAPFYTLLLSTIALFYDEVAGKYSPYADIILANYLFIGVLLFVLAMMKKESLLLILGLILLSFLGWLKNEGLFPVALSLAVFLFLSRYLKLKKGPLYFPIVGVINIPWWLFRKYYKVAFSLQSFEVFSNFSSFLQKIQSTTRVFLEKIFSLSDYNILWFLFIFVMVFNIKKLFKPQILLPFLFIAWQFIIVFLFHFLTRNDPVNILRLIFPYSPLALFVIATLSFKYLHSINFIE